MADNNLGTAHVNAALVFGQINGQQVAQQIQHDVNGQQIGQQIGNNVSTGVAQTAPDAGEDFGLGFLASAAGAIAASAIVSDALGTAFDVETGTAKLTAQLALTGEESAKYGKIAGELYKNAYGESMEETNEAVYAVLGSIKDARNMTADEVQGMAADILNITSTYGLGTEEVTRSAQNAINSGLVPDFESAVDLITSGYQRMGQTGLDWGDTVSEYGGDFKNLGLDAGQALSAVSALVANGAMNTDVAADGIREFGIRMREGADATKEALTSIGVDANAMVADFQAGGPRAAKAFQIVTDALHESGNAAAYAALIGTQAEDNYKTWSQVDLSGAVTSVKDFSGAAESMNAVLGDTNAAALQSIQRNFEMLFTDVLIPIIAQFTPYLQDMVKLFSENADTIAAIAGPIIVVAGGFAAITTAISVYNTVAGIWATVTTAQTGAQWGLNAALLANPMTWVIVAIVALVAALVWFFTQTELGKEVWENTTTAIGDAMSWLWNDILQPTFAAIGEAFTWLWVNVLQPIGNAIVTAWNAIGEAISWVWTTILKPIFDMWVRVMQAIAVIAVWLYITIIQPIFTGIGDAVSAAWTDRIQPVFGAIGAGLQAVGGWFTWLWTTIIQPVLGAVGAGLNVAWTTTIKPVFDWIGGALKVVGDAFSTVFGAIGGKVSEGFSGVVDFIKGIINQIIDLVNSAIGGLNQMGRDVAKATHGAVDIKIAPVPSLAEGATILPTDGGTLVRVAEAGRAESVVDTGVLNSQMDELARLKGGATDNSNSVSINITVNGRDRSDSELAKAIGREAGKALRVQPQY